MTSTVGDGSHNDNYKSNNNNKIKQENLKDILIVHIYVYIYTQYTNTYYPCFSLKGFPQREGTHLFQKK